MIDHIRKIIFIHIARTGGSTIEKMFLGKDFWFINPNEKHIPAQTARNLYKPYWKQYYKFTILRNPFERIRSLAKHKDKYGISLNSDGEIEMEEYKNMWNYPYVCETNKVAPINVVSVDELSLWRGSAYQNLLSDDIDIFKFEEYAKILDTLKARFDLDLSNIEWLEKSLDPKPPLSQKSIELIREIHSLDFARFGYSPISI